MKKFTKVMLITAGIFGILGIGFTAGGVVMGASVEQVELFQRLRNYYGDGDLEEDDGEDLEKVSNLKKELNGTTKDGVKSYEFTEVNTLDVELPYDNFIMQKWDRKDFCIEIEGDDLEKITVYQEGKEVSIHSKKMEKNQKEDGRYVTIYYPDKTHFQDVDVEMEIGSAEFMDNLDTDSFSLSVGAGEGIGYEKITASEMELEVGVGSLSMDVIDAQKISMECGLGEMDIILAGKDKDYRIEADSGLSNITIGGSEIEAAIGNHIWGSQSAPRAIDVECGLGSINMDFEEDDYE